MLNGMFGSLGLNQQHHQQQQQPQQQQQHQTINVVHQNGYNNYLNGSTISRLVSTNDTITGNSKHHEQHHVNLFPQQQQQQQQEINTNRSEKINDIYVNRNVGQLYGPIITTTKPAKTILLYDDTDFTNSYHGFYLHNPKGTTLNGSNNNSDHLFGDTKIYNAFSKQRQPYYAEVHRNAENNIVPDKVSSNLVSAVQKAKRTPLKNWPSNDVFEDDELSNILG